MKKILILILMLFVFVGCTNDNPPSFQFSENKLILEINDQDLLPLELNNITIDNLTFHLSDISIVSLEGFIITAQQIGTTTLTIYDNLGLQLSDSIEIEVTPMMPHMHVAMDGITINQTVKIDILNYPIYEDFIWENDNPTVLSLNNAYTARGLSLGFATITIIHKENPAITSSITIEVMLDAPQLTAHSDLIQVAQSMDMMIMNVNGYTKDDFTWTIDNPAIIFLTETYTVTGLQEGSTTIHIVHKTNPRLTASFDITVGTPSTSTNHLGEIDQGPLFIVPENPTATVQAGETINLDVEGLKSKTNYRWYSSDASIVAATDQGVIHGIKEGRAIVLVVSKTDPNVSGQITINVVGTPNVNYIERLIQAATNEIGYREGPNDANKYGDWFGFNNVAWCAIFVSWSANQAGIGIDVIPKYSSVTFGMMWYQMQGRFEYKEDYIPKAGDIIFFKSSGASHTGIVTSSDGVRVYTVEGNTSNQVAARSYVLDYHTITEYGLPDYPPHTG